LLRLKPPERIHGCGNQGELIIPDLYDNRHKKISWTGNREKSTRESCYLYSGAATVATIPKGLGSGEGNWEENEGGASQQSSTTHKPRLSLPPFLEEWAAAIMIVYSCSGIDAQDSHSMHDGDLGYDAKE